MVGVERSRRDLRRPLRAARAAGFTLIEILVVVAIIVILLASVVAIGTQTRAGAQIRSTKMTLKALHALAEKYRDENGTEPGSGTTDFVTKFLQVPAFKTRLDALGPSVFNGSSVLDGFGNAIRYEPSSVTGTAPAQVVTPFRFASNGADAIANNADDILSTDP